MGPISAKIEIDIPRERAFAFLSDLGNRPSFTDHFLSDFHLTRLESSGVGAGARFRVEQPLRSVWMDTAISELEAPYLIRERGNGGRLNRIRTNTAWELTEGPGSLTTVRLAHWTEPGPVDRGLELASAASFWQQRSWREALRRLRDLLESETPRPARLAVAGGNRYATGVP